MSMIRYEGASSTYYQCEICYAKNPSALYIRKTHNEKNICSLVVNAWG
jgi:hypothetical protein